MLESARFSYLRGDDNDLVEKTTILVFPGNHLIDNRPGYGIRDNGSGNALAVAPGGATFNAQEELTLTLNSNFDLTQEDNILYKFNSVRGGIIIPRGTSIVGLDLRKTKVRQNMFLTQQTLQHQNQQSLELLVLATSGNLPSLMVMKQVLYIQTLEISHLIIGQNQLSLTINSHALSMLMV